MSGRLVGAFGRATSWVNGHFSRQKAAIAAPLPLLPAGPLIAPAGVNGSLRRGWDYLIEDVWIPLSTYATNEAAAPEDLFSDLFGEASDFLAPPPSRTEMEEARNNPLRARARFLALRGSDFETESSLVQFLESAYEVVEGYEIAGYAEYFRGRVRNMFQKFNVRYRLDDPFVVRFMLPGSFANLYNELERINAADAHLSTLLRDFEVCFDRYARTLDPADLRVCIARASNYAEGLASATLGVPLQHNTLGALARQLTDWPHEKVRDALLAMYAFCSDYPGIRHSGNPRSAQRALSMRDVTLASLLLLSFAGYLSPQIDERAVLGA